RPGALPGRQPAAVGALEVRPRLLVHAERRGDLPADLAGQIERGAWGVGRTKPAHAPRDPLLPIVYHQTRSLGFRTPRKEALGMPFSAWENVTGFDFKDILYEKKYHRENGGGVARVTINRPQKLNAFTD